MIYQFRLGYSLAGVTAQVVGETLADLEKKHGKVTPADVVSEARRPTHPLHRNFEWNDERAADQHRLEQARGIIRSVEVVTVMENGQQHRELGYVSIHENKADGAGYINTRAAMADEKFSTKVIQDAEAQLAGWRRRYGELLEIQNKFGAVIEAIDKVLQDATTQEIPNGEDENQEPAAARKRPPKPKPGKPAIAAKANRASNQAGGVRHPGGANQARG